MTTVDAQAAKNGLLLLQAKLREAEVQILRAVVQVAEDEAKATELFKDRSGETRGSIRGQVSGTRGTVTAGGVARFIENGTRPHIIAARNAKALRFVRAGTVVFRKSVWHPGTPARPFMEQARNRAEMAAEYAADFYLGAALR